MPGRGRPTHRRLLQHWNARTTPAFSVLDCITPPLSYTGPIETLNEISSWADYYISYVVGTIPSKPDRMIATCMNAFCDALFVIFRRFVYNTRTKSLRNELQPIATSSKGKGNAKRNIRGMCKMKGNREGRRSHVGRGEIEAALSTHPERYNENNHRCQSRVMAHVIWS